LAYQEIAAQLGRLASWPVLPFAPLFWKYQEQCLPYFLLDAPHHVYEDAEAVMRAYHLLDDEESRGEYLLQLSYLLSAMDYLEVARPPAREWYFPRQLVELSPEEVFVDCGAYDGDTIVNYLEACGGSFGKIVAFEPDPLAFARLHDLVEDLAPTARSRIDLRKTAVGAKATTLRFEGGGTPGSRVAEDGSLAVECVPLDAALQGSPPTFIKMDIEGGEEEALRGATQIIRAHRPILAICVYHLQAHLYRLPLLIRDICHDYRLFMRRLGNDGDLVCFAVPNERLTR
jgi:FkbM family methyltransferase